jgi:flagellar biosynthesis component FlhA
VSNLIAGAVKQANASGHYPVVLTQPQVRAVVRQLIEGVLPTTSVLGYNEVASGVDVESVAMVSPPGAEAARAGAAA